ncbi:MAG TPA: hypothetical protein DIW37_03795, partial [Chryseobacterium sp.]|nr:hypothetical protein [Chryseobacterium sp.]
MEKTFSKLIELISEKIFAKELDSNELTEISNFCSSASKFKFNKDFDGFTKFKQVYVENAKIFARIPTKDGQDAITLFNQQMFSNYRRIFILTPKIIDFLLKESSNIIEVYFLQREFDMLRLDIAYKNTSDNIYYFMEGEPMIPMNDFTHRQEEFESEVGLQRILDNGLNPNKFGCPKRLEIDKKDLKEFLEFKK